MHSPSLIVNTLVLVHAVSFMLQGYRLFAHACHLRWHFHHQLRTVILLCAPSDIGFYAGPLTSQQTLPKYSSDSWPWNAIHSSGCLPQCCVLISSSRMRSCQYDNHRERNPFLPPTSRINAAHLHTEPTLVRQQLKPQPSGGGVDVCEPQIYKLDFYPFTSCSLPSTRQLRRCWLCGLHARCNYNHLCQNCITHDRKELSGDTCDPVTNEWAAW